MVKDLNNFLPCHCFLDKAIEVSHVFLLLGKEDMAFFAAVPEEQEHAEKGSKYNKGQQWAQHNQHGKSSNDNNKALDDCRETVVHGVRYGINIVCETAHQFAMGVLIEEGKRKSLYFPEKVTTDFQNNFLCDFYHKLSIAVRRQDTGKV